MTSFEPHSQTKAGYLDIIADQGEDEATRSEKLARAETNTGPASESRIGPESLETWNDDVAIAASIFSSAYQDENHEDSAGRRSVPRESLSEIRDAVARKFAPLVQVSSSGIVDSLVRDNIGVSLNSLLTSAGDKIRGKVVIRDGSGSSRAYDDYRVRFRLHESTLAHERVEGQKTDVAIDDEICRSLGTQQLQDAESSIKWNRLDRWVAQGQTTDGTNTESTGPPHLFLDHVKDLLERRQIIRSETFQHPVAHMFFVAAGEKEPLDVIVDLSRNADPEPAWMGKPCLKYHVLVHVDTVDDFSRSHGIYESMKRSLGLHCFLLRLQPDKPRIPVNAGQRHEYDRNRADSEPETATSDAVTEAIALLVREFVTQSVIPSMESRVFLWNEQVASKRKGFGGRIMSFSKRWTGLGSTRSTSSGSGISTPNSRGATYDPSTNSYPADAPEALLRQLGDYAMMLRDYKLANETYDSVRSDYAQDQAWAYHASVNEMASLSLLMLDSRTMRRPEILDQYLESATYTYANRCAYRYEIARTLTTVIGLMSHVSEDWANALCRKWTARLLDLRLYGRVGQCLIAHRFSESLAAVSTFRRCRQAALWSVVTAQTWQQIGSARLSAERLHNAKILYGLPPSRQISDLGRYEADLLDRLDDGKKTTPLDQAAYLSQQEQQQTSKIMTSPLEEGFAATAVAG